MRTTIAVLKKAWAMIIPNALASREKDVPSRRKSLLTEIKDDETTTVGNTKGIVDRTRRKDRPLNRSLVTVLAINVPSRRDSKVDSAACQKVNQIIFQIPAEP